MNLNKNTLNNVKNRFLPIPEGPSKCLEKEPKISDFECIKELGTGSFGRVYLVYHKITKAKYAIKAINKNNKSNIKEKPYFRREIEIMYRINHPNVVKLYGHFEDNNFCYFIMEYIPKGNAYSLIPKHGRKKQTNQLIASIIKDIVSAVYFLHKMNPPIIHRDIKPENVLMDENDRAILTDFGWSNYLNDSEKRNTICGTPIYLAPEMINSKGHNEKVDIWCIGVLLFELITGKVPFRGKDIDTLKYNIRTMKIAWPSDINNEAKDLISKMLKYNPNDRLTHEEILNHTFIRKYFPKAVDQLIIPDENIKYKIFVVSVDNPKNWDPILTEEDSDNYGKTFNTENNIQRKYKRTNTINGYNRKINEDYSPYKFEKKFTLNNKENNYNTINSNNNKYDRYNKYTNYNTDNYNEHKYNNYRKYDSYDRYDSLSKKYDKLKQDFYLLKKNTSDELDKLKKELREKENKISELTKDGRIYDFSERNYRRKKQELKELEMIYEELKIENNELKERIKYYTKYIKEKKKLYYEDNFNEIRNSIRSKNKANFSKAMDKLKIDLDEDTLNYFNAIIKEKEKQIEKYKEDVKLRMAKEKQKFSVLINKYDRTLSWQEQENKDLKIRLQELERKFL